MIIGIISDSHDNIWNLEKAIKKMKEKSINILIHCGDFCAPFIIDQLAAINLPVHCVFGNIDDRFTTTRKCDKFSNITLHGEIAELELDEKSIAVTHLPKFAKGLAHTGDYDIVFYGHTHKNNCSKIENTLLVNPGEIMGRLGKPSFAIYDTSSEKVEFFDI